MKMKDHYDVAVNGLWWAVNYGSQLNGYAVYKILKSFGLSVLMIQKPNAAPDDWEVRGTQNMRFIDKFYPPDEVSPFFNYEQLKSLNTICDTFITGSDQLWNYYINRAFNLSFFLNFVDDTKKRISFSTSFGYDHDTNPKDILPSAIDALRKFNAVSVREQSAVNICQEIYGINATMVIEPVFCLDKNEYVEIARKSNINETEPYIVTYILDPTPEKKRAIQYYSEALGMKAINVLDGDPRFDDKNRKIMDLPNTLGQIGAEDLIKLYLDCSFVITDAFHGTAFSIIFNKPFIAIANEKRGAVRFKDLLGRFNLMDRLITDATVIPEDKRYLEPVNYTEINKIIKVERKHAIEWLRNAIFTPAGELPDIKSEKNPEIPVNTELPDDIRHCKILVALLKAYGIQHVVLSSGTRHVQLVCFFEQNPDDFIVHNVVDERSAGFVALGIAAKLHKPVVVCCTSGTAASNYLSAISEAYYQHIPLIFITADRYPYLLNQREEQMVPQQNMFNDVCLKEITLPIVNGRLGDAVCRRMICETILETTHRAYGPTHINVPMQNVDRLDDSAYKLDHFEIHRINRYMLNPNRSTWFKAYNYLKRTQRILILYGQNHCLDDDQQKALEAFVKKYNCVVCTDNLSNVKCSKSVNIYNLISQNISKNDVIRKLKPDVVITVYGNSVSGIRGFLNKAGYFMHWDVNESGNARDPYRKLRCIFECSPTQFFQRMSVVNEIQEAKDTYYRMWNEYLCEDAAIPSEYSQRYTVYNTIKRIPSKSLLHLANSLTVRFACEFNLQDDVEVYCNRGTNGIDGSASSFMGQAMVSEEKCFLLIGDLSFFYDMNSLWNKQLRGNVKIMLFNNSGASLLKFHHSNAITYEHHTIAEGWVKSLGFRYLSSHSKEEFDAQIEEFVADADIPMFFEVFC